MTSIPSASESERRRKYRFRDFELDLAAHRLTRAGAPIRLERRPFDLLVLLVQRPGELVTREEIVSRLWPSNVIVDFDAGVNTLVRKVRQALDDSSDTPAFIETVSGRGYRFVGPIDEPERLPAAPAEVHSTSTTAPTARPRRRLVALTLLLLVAGATSAAWWALRGEPGPTGIAVLPFENLTGDPGYGYLAIGLAEETSASLTKIDPARVKVIGTTTARALAEATEPLSSLGPELGVAFVVRSTLQAEGNRLRVSASLVRVEDDHAIWSAVFDRQITNLLELQRELSVAIAEQVRLHLSPETTTRFDERHTRDAEAFRLYLKGRDEWRRLTPAGIRDAVDYYRQAVARDPHYALAWAGIAQVLSSATMTADARPLDETTVLARQAIEQAVTFGAEISEVRHAQGQIALFLDLDPVAAEAHARAAVALDPNSALAQLFLGIVLSHVGRHAEALAATQRARALDPLFAQTFALSSQVAKNAGDYPAAVEYATQALAINPQFWVAHLHLGHAHVALGELEAALRDFSNAERFSEGNSKATSFRALVLVRLGRVDEAREILRALRARAEAEYVPPMAFALIHAALNEPDAALDALEDALAVRDTHLLGLKEDPDFESLRDEPRFQQLVARCGC